MSEIKFGDLKTGVRFVGKEYFCALELALELIGGKWKIMMIYHLRNGALRSSELQWRMGDISAKCLRRLPAPLKGIG